MTHLLLDSGKQLYVASQSLQLEHGGQIDHPNISYELSGPKGAPLLLILGGISAHAHVSETEKNPEKGWWSTQVGPGKGIDTREFQILSVDYLGSPESPLPKHFSLGGPAFSSEGPVWITSRDQANLIDMLLQGLGVSGLEAVVGYSYGGMVAQSWVAKDSTRVKHLFVLGAAHRSDSHAQAFRVVQRKVLALGLDSGVPLEVQHKSVELARALGVLSYRTPIEFRKRFKPAPVWMTLQPSYEVEKYLESQGSRFAGRFDAESYLLLSQAIDLHEICPSRLHCPTTVVACSGDQISPSTLMEEFWSLLPEPYQYLQIRSESGHDAFLKENDELKFLFASHLGSLDRIEVSRHATV